MALYRTRRGSRCVSLSLQPLTLTTNSSSTCLVHSTLTTWSFPPLPPPPLTNSHLSTLFLPNTALFILGVFFSASPFPAHSLSASPPSSHSLFLYRGATIMRPSLFFPSLSRLSYTERREREVSPSLYPILNRSFFSLFYFFILNTE